MKIVYIAHPVSGDVRGNIEKIIAIAKDINKSYREVVPFVPYLVDLFALDDSVPAERARGIKNDIAIFNKGIIDELWLFGDRISNGMAAEIQLANDLSIPVFPMTAETKEQYEKTVLLPNAIEVFEKLDFIKSAGKIKINHPFTGTIKDSTRESERKVIIAALQVCNYNKTKVAKMLGVDRKTIYNKISSLNINDKTVD